LNPVYTHGENESIEKLGFLIWPLTHEIGESRSKDFFNNPLKMFFKIPLCYFFLLLFKTSQPNLILIEA